MEIILSISCLIIALIATIAMIISYNQKKIEVLKVRLEEARKNIHYFLEKKEENLEKAIPVIVNSNKRKYGKKEILKDLIKKKNLKRDLFEKDRDLKEVKKEFLTLLEEDEKLQEKKEINEIYFDMIDIENDLTASKKYYNRIANKMEKEIQKFPRNLLKRLWKYEPSEKFDTKKEVDLEILKEEETSSPNN